MESTLEFRVLGACAVPRPHARQQERLASLLKEPIRWVRLVELAQIEGMSALAWEHLRNQSSVPEDSRLELAGISFQQRRLSTVQEQVLSEA